MTDNKVEYGVYNLPVNQTSVEGSCGKSTNETNELTIKWDSNKIKSKMQFVFNKNETNKDYNVSSINFDIDIVGESFPNAEGMYLYLVVIF